MLLKSFFFLVKQIFDTSLASMLYRDKILELKKKANVSIII